MIDVKLFFFIVFQIFVLIKCEEAEAQERDFHKGYFAPSEDEKIDYQGLRYPSNYYNQHFMTNG